MSEPLVREIVAAMKAEDRALSAIDTAGIKTALAKLAGVLVLAAKDDPVAWLTQDEFGDTPFRKAYVKAATPIVMGAYVGHVADAVRRGQQDGRKRVKVVNV